MYPSERSLVKKLKDEPFALLGVNSDPLETIKKARKEKDLTWRAWWDGGNTRGPIATEWGVHGWPTIYVLDGEGRIRFTGVRNEKMEQAVEFLLKEMKDKKKDGDKDNESDGDDDH